MRVAITLALLVLVACAPEPVRPSVPYVPAGSVSTPEVAPAPAPAEAEVPLPTAMAASEVRDALFHGTRPGDHALTADDVRCSFLNRTLAFTFRNTDGRSWRFSGGQPLGAGLVEAQVTINQYQLTRHAYTRDGRQLFGPHATLGENCGNLTVLAPFESATCAFTNVPLRDIYHAGGVNEIYINVPGAAEDARVEFLC